MLAEPILRNLYLDRELSMPEVAQQLGTTQARVLSWLRKHGVPRRTASQSTYAKRKGESPLFIIPTILNSGQRELMVAAMMLYWAEGNKTASAIRIANLDPRMLVLFLRFLREICHVDNRRVRLYARIHPQFDLQSAAEFWSRVLELSLSQVRVYPHIDRRSRAGKQWSRFGLATLEFHSKQFKAWFDAAIESYLTDRWNLSPFRDVS